MTDENIVTFKKDTILYTEGEMVTHFYIIKNGEVRLLKQTENSIETVSVLYGGNFVGEVEFFIEQPRITSAVAMSDLEVVAIKKTDVMKVLKLCPNWVSDIMSTLSERYSDSVNVLREHGIFDSDPSHQLDSKDKATILKRLQEKKKRI